MRQNPHSSASDTNALAEENQSLYSSGLFVDARHYDISQPIGGNWDHKFFLERAKRLAGPVLEIGCGTGRVSIPLAKEGLDVTGLDLSEPMLREARRKADADKVRITFHHADCREFNLGRRFSLIYFPYNSFNILLDRESVEKFFSRVHSHLRPEGELILSVFHYRPGNLIYPPDHRYAHDPYADPDGRGTVERFLHCSYQPVSQVLRHEWKTVIGGKSLEEVQKLNLRVYFPEELKTLLHYNGFEVAEAFGDFSGGSFTNDSKAMIFVCKAT